jgi:hypothetical protein
MRSQQCIDANDIQYQAQVEDALVIITTIVIITGTSDFPSVILS